MNEPDQEHNFIDRVRKTLDEGTDHLDPQVQSRLAGMRRTALDAGERPRIEWRRWFTLPVTGWAMAAVLVIVLMVYLQQPGSVPAELDDIELLAAEDNLEFYDSLEFYAWLAEEESEGATDAG